MNKSESIFISEANELMLMLEDALLILDEDRFNSEALNQAFRAVHTLKGSGLTMGYIELARFAHRLEDVLDLVRSGSMRLTQEIIEIFFSFKDHISTLLIDKNKIQNHPKSDEIIKLINGYLSNKNVIDENERLPFGEKNIGNKNKFLISITPNQESIVSGLDPLPILLELKAIGDLEIKAKLTSIPSIQEFDPNLLYISFLIELTTFSTINKIKEIFIFVANDWNIRIEHAGEKSNDTPESSYPLSSENNATLDNKYESSKVKGNSNNSFLKIPSKKLDDLMDMVGELVINQSRLEKLNEELSSEDLDVIIADVKRLVNEIRDATLNVRMLPISFTCDRYRRVIRDASKRLGKKIRFVTEGAGTELDKNVLDKLNDSLVHIVRNCVDHGLETPEIRNSLGKPETGTLKLSAFRRDSRVIIEISDDGKGIDLDKIKSKAIQLGLITQESKLTEQEILSLVFEPGLSTCEEVSDFSGRGVGMDSVKRTIMDLNGEINIETKKNHGTKIIIEFPLTMAIIDGLLSKIGSECYILPLESVIECQEISKNAVSLHRPIFLHDYHDAQIPAINLSKWFDIKTQHRNFLQIIIVKTKTIRFGLLVDFVVGQQQIVLKRLSKFYENVQGINGATILGDGNVGLIIDVDSFARTLKNTTQTITTMDV